LAQARATQIVGPANQPPQSPIIEAMQTLVSALLVGVSLASPSWKTCELKPCLLQSKYATAGPAFKDIVRLNAMQVAERSKQEKCPFGGADDDKEPSKAEWTRYMKGIAKVGDMDSAERREWAIRESAKMEAQIADGTYKESKRDKGPIIDVAAKGIEAVNRTTLARLREENKHDLLIAFYAPWCPHCKEFIVKPNAPINALNAVLEKKHGPKVVTFDIEASDAPEALGLTSIPTIFLIKTNGQAIQYEQNPHDLKLLTAFALGTEMPAPAALIAKPVSQHLRKPAL